MPNLPISDLFNGTRFHGVLRLSSVARSFLVWLGTFERGKAQDLWRKKALRKGPIYVLDEGRCPPLHEQPSSSNKVAGILRIKREREKLFNWEACHLSFQVQIEVRNDHEVITFFFSAETAWHWSCDPSSHEEMVRTGIRASGINFFIAWSLHKYYNGRNLWTPFIIFIVIPVGWLNWKVKEIKFSVASSSANGQTIFTFSSTLRSSARTNLGFDFTEMLLSIVDQS